MINDNRLPINLVLKGLPLLQHLAQASAQILDLKVCACLGTLVFLPRLIISIDALVVIEVDILLSTGGQVLSLLLVVVEGAPCSVIVSGSH